MTKHIADKRTTSDTPRKKHFWAMEKRSGEQAPHPAIRALVQRPQGHSGTRLQHYLRIARGHMA
ncbi:hypothetical protein EOK75_07680 [Pseudorhodobacter turbinis]|uniref:Uncharacterized protein n=1 Tax=Pseudorhodobacter turbinis TaxID=2500533 RepID=A0A4P8EFP0_9RHOB|nr:hypothetical protein [Pseudorhodobacter turbinis]QCO55627.1 hypothetical protein EOK75_07680 [Pseudorhodobacter turbinis]